MHEKTEHNPTGAGAGKIGTPLRTHKHIVKHAMEQMLLRVMTEAESKGELTVEKAIKLNNAALAWKARPPKRRIREDKSKVDRHDPETAAMLREEKRRRFYGRVSSIGEVGNQTQDQGAEPEEARTGT